MATVHDSFCVLCVIYVVRVGLVLMHEVGMGPVCEVVMDLMHEVGMGMHTS